MTAFKNALITGASSGIGRCLARQLAERGTRVVVAARRKAELESLAVEIRSRGGSADVCPLDVRDTQRVAEAVTHWDERTGGLDLVVANAGRGLTRPGHKLRWSDVEPVVQINVVGAFATLVSAIGPMVARGRGTLAATSSVAGMRGLPTAAAYSASKAALSTFLESLRIDLAPKGVKVVEVRPGFVDTALVAKNRIPMPFLLQEEDAARRALRGISRGQAVVSFPWPYATTMRIVEAMPEPLYRTIAALGRPRHRKR